MELQFKGTFLLVDAFNAKIVCDQCSEAHVKCSREAPICFRCRRMGVKCSRNRSKRDAAVIQGLSRAEQRLRPLEVRITNWLQAIDSFSMVPLARFHLRRIIMPLEFLLPKLSESSEILKMSVAATKPKPYNFETRIPLQLEYLPHETYDILALAISTFFKMFNPSIPLFSEEGFHSRPRSQTIKKLVVQIGLERMTQTDLVRATMQKINFTAADLRNLPNNLDTLQCLLLAQFGARLSWLSKVRFRIFCTTNRLLTLLGLHNTPLSSPQWLERTLALNATSLGGYFLSAGQSITWTKTMWLQPSTEHTKPSFLPKMTNHNHFPHFNDRIHFIASQAIYSSFLVVINASREKTLLRREKEPSYSYARKITSHLKKLKDNFMWGWLHLSHLSSIPHSQPQLLLLRQSQLSLALRYNNDYIEIMKLASYIPSDNSKPISATPITNKITQLTEKGLSIAVQTIHLASTLVPAPFDCDCILIQIPAIAFIIAHLKATKSDPICRSQLSKALFKARHFLQQGTRIPFHSAKAKAYLELIDYFLRQHKIV